PSRADFLVHAALSAPLARRERLADLRLARRAAAQEMRDTAQSAPGPPWLRVCSKFDWIAVTGQGCPVRPVNMRLISAVVCASLGLACGPGCGTPGPAQQAQPVPPSETAAGPGPAPAPVQVAVAPPGPTPVLSDAARTARLSAQRTILGERAALLEDSAGQPFPVIGAAADGEIQRTLMPGAGRGNLDALPGSEGTGPAGT